MRHHDVDRRRVVGFDRATYLDMTWSASDVIAIPFLVNADASQQPFMTRDTTIKAAEPPSNAPKPFVMRPQRGLIMIVRLRLSDQYCVACCPQRPEQDCWSDRLIPVIHRRCHRERGFCWHRIRNFGLTWHEAAINYLKVSMLETSRAPLRESEKVSIRY